MDPATCSHRSAHLIWDLDTGEYALFCDECRLEGPYGALRAARGSFYRKAERIKAERLAERLGAR
jgi:hypothetical protein